MHTAMHSNDLSLNKVSFCVYKQNKILMLITQASVSHKDKETITPSPMPNVFF